MGVVDGIFPVPSAVWKQAPYRLPHAYREIVQKELQEMQRDGTIEPSTSEWASPIVLVPKKDGSLCMYVDYYLIVYQTHTQCQG